MLRALVGSIILIMLPSVTLADARGIRNNNPFNIQKTSIKWDGEVECPDRIHECFKTADHGLRAGAILLHNYYHRHDLRTVEQIITRLGPKSPKYARHLNNYIQFARNVAGHSLCGRSYKDATVRLIYAIVRFENGYVPYTTGQIWKAVRSISDTPTFWECPVALKWHAAWSIPDEPTRVPKRYLPMARTDRPDLLTKPLRIYMTDTPKDKIILNASSKEELMKQLKEIEKAQEQKDKSLAASIRQSIRGKGRKGIIGRRSKFYSSALAIGQFQLLSLLARAYPRQVEDASGQSSAS